jgi:hypothetical protein
MPLQAPGGSFPEGLKHPPANNFAVQLQHSFDSGSLCRFLGVTPLINGHSNAFSHLLRR